MRWYGDANVLRISKLKRFVSTKRGDRDLSLKRSVMRLFLLLLSLSSVTCAHEPARNLLRNPEFTKGTQYWTVPEEPFESGWMREGASGKRGVVKVKEIMRMNRLSGQTGDATGAFQCVAVDPSQRYDFGAAVFIPPSQTQQGEANVVIPCGRPPRWGQ